MKIFFRYLFMRLFSVFAICLVSVTLIWIMVDLYGNIDDFLEHKVKFLVVLQFYVWNIPKMLVQVLPATILFSTLFTMVSLNRRSELVAFQAGGMAPLLMFSPFVLFACIWVGVLAYDMSGPSAMAEVTRQRLLKEVKGGNSARGGFTSLAYVDNINHRSWFFQNLNSLDGKGHATRVEITQRDAQDHDMLKYSANEAEWTGEFWRLTGGVAKSVVGTSGFFEEPKRYAELDLPDITTPPKQLTLIVSQPEQLTLNQLSQYIATNATTPELMARYSTEWWYRVFYPFSLLVLLFYALLNGMPANRRTGMVGVMWAGLAFAGYLTLTSILLAAGRNNRLSPVVAVIAGQLIFGVLGLHLLAVANGWWWQLRQSLKKGLTPRRKPVET